MTQYTFDTYKLRQSELLKAAEKHRMATEGQTNDGHTANPAVVWLGHRLIELGEKLSAETVETDNKVALANG